MKTNQELNSLALRARRLLGEDSYSPIDVFAVINGWSQQKITVVRYPFPAHISGMCTKEENDVIIAVSSVSSYGRQRFTLAHELYHVLFDKGQTRVICDMGMGDDKTETEREADLFASYFLMPYDALMQYAEAKEQWELKDVIEAEQFFQVSHQAMLFRLKLDGYITKEQEAEYKGIAVSRVAARLGYGRELYYPMVESKQYFTTGEYIRKVERLAEAGKISAGKREELLLDAFRADIVYNFDEEDMELND